MYSELDLGAMLPMVSVLYMMKAPVTGSMFGFRKRIQTWSADRFESLFLVQAAKAMEAKNNRVRERRDMAVCILSGETAGRRQKVGALQRLRQNIIQIHFVLVGHAEAVVAQMDQAGQRFVEVFSEIV